MPRRIQFSGGPNPWTDIEKFIAKLRKAKVGISDLGIQQMVKRATGLHDPLTSNRVIILLGADIMSENVQLEPWWPDLPFSQANRLLSHPISGGAMVDNEDAKASQLSLLSRQDYGSINRSALVSPRGLTRTYIFMHRDGFIQDVEDRDADLILSFPTTKRLFQDVGLVGVYEEVSSYQHIQVRETHHAGNLDDAKALAREFRPTKKFGGVTLDTAEG